MGATKATSKESGVLGIRGEGGDIGSKILGENPARHCFVLRNLVLTNFSNKS